MTAEPTISNAQGILATALEALRRGDCAAAEDAIARVYFVLGVIPRDREAPKRQAPATVP